MGSYLMGQALAYTADDLRGFLLQTSVSEFLDAELADQLTGRSDSALCWSGHMFSRDSASIFRTTLALSLSPDVSCTAACRTDAIFT